MINVVDASHLNPRNAPESIWGLGGTFSWPIGNGDLEIFAKYTLIAEVDAHLLNLQQSKIDDRDDLAMTIGYHTEDWSVAAFGRNLTDEQYEIFIPIAQLFAAGTVNRPRSYGVEFSMNF